MGRHLGHADGGVHQDGRAGGGHDAVVGGSGHAHAQHDAAEHGQHQSHHHMAAGKVHDGAEQLGGKTGHGDAAGDHTGHAAGHSHGDRALGAALQRAEDHGAQVLHRVLTGLLPAGAGIQDQVRDADHHGGHDGQSRGISHGIGVGGHQHHQQHQGEQQVDPLHENAQLGQLVPGDALEAQLLGLQMHSDVDAGEIQHGRQDGPHGDGAVRLAGELGHEEGGSAHDRRHDLAAGGSGSLHGAGELALIAGLFHHGDGNGAGSHGVAHGGAGHHAAQGGGDDGHLGGAAGGGAGHGVGQADEEAGDAGALQERAEDDEHDDELGTHVHRTAENAVGGIEHGADHLVDGHAQLLSGEGVGPHQVEERIDEHFQQDCVDYIK